MRRITVIHAVWIVAMMSVLLAGCSSTSSTSRTKPCPVENEVMLAGYEAGAVAGSFESLGLELSMPLWFISGK
jgi:uncharacterized protein YceK